jgi:hypothetical protein
MAAKNVKAEDFVAQGDRVGPIEESIGAVRA